MNESVQSRFEIVGRLHQSLPSMTGGWSALDIESQARAVLLYVTVPVLNGILPSSTGAVLEDPTRCPNCDMPVASSRSPYCSEQCREMAGFVRQFRAGLVLNWIFEPEKQVALGQVLWHVRGGGRPLRREIAPPRSRTEALKRAGGICQSCGDTATTVDHIGSGCNRSINLRAVCETCCTDIPFGDPRVVDHPEFASSVNGIAARIVSDIPVRSCDNSESWDWRDYLSKRNFRQR